MEETLKAKLIDTHAHINMLSNPEMGIIEAKDVGVEKIVVPSSGLEDFEVVLSLSERFDGIYIAFGLHPENCNQFNDETAKKIIELSKKDKVVALGEIGLDYHYSKENKDEQKNVFINQLEIAKMLDLPVLIHDREAHFDTLEILSKYNMKKVLLHCFSGSVEFMKQCVDLGYKIAVGGVVTFKNAKEIKEVVKAIDINDLMLETDSPFLTPHPFRGEENSPKYLGFVAKAIADLKNMPYDEVVNITNKNAKDFFNIND